MNTDDQKEAPQVKYTGNVHVLCKFKQGFSKYLQPLIRTLPAV